MDLLNIIQKSRPGTQCRDQHKKDSKKHNSSYLFLYSPMPYLQNHKFVPYAFQPSILKNPWSRSEDGKAVSDIAIGEEREPYLQQLSVSVLKH